MAAEGWTHKLSHFFALDPEDETDPSDASKASDEAQEAARTPSRPSSAAPAFRGNKVVAMNTPQDKQAKIVVYEPRIYSDGKEIGNHLLNNKAVVVNFDRIEADDAKRIVDFLTGVVFAINGEIKRVGEQIFLVTPANFTIDGSLAATLGVDVNSDFDMRTE